MLYNIWLEVAALGFIILIWVFYKVQYQSRNEINKRFEVLICAVFFYVLMDVASAITISYSKSLPYAVNYLFNGIYYILVCLSAYAFVRYMRTLVGSQNTFFAKVERLATILYVVSEIINPFFGYYYFFDETGYVHGPAYVFQMLFCYALVITSTGILFANRKRLSVRIIVGTGAYLGMMLVSVAVQIFFIPDFLLTGFSSTLSLFVIYLLMETPDYYKLMETMEELEKARIEANMANEAKSRFLANMSHEIRTPLNTVLGMDEMILREESSEEILDYARNIKSSGTTLLKIINDILDFSKIESGMLAIKPYDYDISSTINNANIMFKMKAEEKGLNFFTNYDEALPKTMHGDEMRISQIIINLVNNAIKYTDKGQIDLSIKQKPSDKENAILLCISVKDSGIGIKDEDMEKLFAEFERLDEEKNRAVEGTGLGLAITSRLVSAMGGKISVESVYGEGSTFSVEIPQDIVDNTPMGKLEIKVEKNDAEHYRQSFTAPDAKILAVDDNKVNLVVLCKLLKMTEVQITRAESGKEALEALEKEAFDIVLLDHMMPEMDGIETLHAAREIDEKTGFNPAYIALTANAISGANETYLAEGFDDYISKPINPITLESKIKNHLPKDKIK